MACSPLDLFTYWLKIPEKDRNRLICYVYREWPKLDPTQTLPYEEQERIRANKGRGGPETNIAKWTEPPMAKPQDWQSEILHQFGCGKYRFLLNDSCGNAAAGTGGGSKNLALAYTEELGDLDTYPPVLRYEHVVKHQPSNEMYVRWCKLKGIRLYGDPQTPFDEEATNQENDDMAANAESVRVLSDAVVQLAKDRDQKPAPPPAAPAPREDSTSAVERVADVMGNIAEKNFDMLSRGLERMSEAKAKEADPFAVADRLIGMSERLVKSTGTPAPPAADNGQNAIIAALLEDLSLIHI